MSKQRVEIQRVLRLVNAARVAAGWSPIDDLPLGRRGVDRNPLSHALESGVGYGDAFGVSTPCIVNFATAWNLPVVYEHKHEIFTTRIPYIFDIFVHQFDEGLFPEYADTDGHDYEPI